MMDGLARVRRAEEEARRCGLAAAIAARAAQERKLESLAAEQVRALQVKRTVLERATVVAELLVAQRHLELLARRLETERAALAASERRVSEAREAWEAASRQVRMLDRLRERAGAR